MLKNMSTNYLPDPANLLPNSTSLLPNPTNLLPDPTTYVKFFCDYIVSSLIKQTKNLYTSVHEFLDQKLIALLTNEKVANEFNKTKNMNLETLIEVFYDVHRKIQIPAVTINSQLTNEKEKEVNEAFNKAISLTVIFYKISIKDNANNSDDTDSFIEKYRKKVINIFKNLYYAFYYFNYIKYFRIKNNKQKRNVATKEYKANLDMKLGIELKKSLEYAFSMINNMDANIHKRNLNVMLEEDLQKKAQDAENEKNKILALGEKSNTSNCLIS